MSWKMLNCFIELDPSLKQLNGTFHFVFILAVPVDKGGSVSPNVRLHVPSWKKVCFQSVYPVWTNQFCFENKTSKKSLNVKHFWHQFRTLQSLHYVKRLDRQTGTASNQDEWVYYLEMNMASFESYKSRECSDWFKVERFWTITYTITTSVEV